MNGTILIKQMFQKALHEEFTYILAESNNIFHKCIAVHRTCRAKRCFFISTRFYGYLIKKYILEKKEWLRILKNNTCLAVIMLTSLSCFTRPKSSSSPFSNASNHFCSSWLQINNYYYHQNQQQLFCSTLNSKGCHKKNTHFHLFYSRANKR